MVWTVMFGGIMHQRRPAAAQDFLSSCFVSAKNERLTQSGMVPCRRDMSPEFFREIEHERKMRTRTCVN